MARIWRKKKGIKEFMELLKIYPPIQGKGLDRSHYVRAIRKYSHYNFNYEYIQNHYNKIIKEVITDNSQMIRTWNPKSYTYDIKGEAIQRIRTEEELIKEMDEFIYRGLGWTDVRKFMDFKEIGLYQSRLNTWRDRYESK